MFDLIILTILGTVLLLSIFTKPKKSSLKATFEQLIRDAVKLAETDCFVEHALKIGIMETMIKTAPMCYSVDNFLFCHVGYVFEKKDAISSMARHIEPREEFVGVFGKWIHFRTVMKKL